MKNLIIIFSVLLIISACSNDETARIRVTMIDAPANYNAVNVDVQDVMINASAGENGWVSISDSAIGTLNLLELVGGLEAVLADKEVPAGKLSQIRLVLGSNNSIVVNGATYALSTPSAQQSGLKLQVHENLEEGITYEFKLDFDAAKSIVESGNGNYSLKPVIRVIVEATSGAITGVVKNTDGMLVSASNGNDTYNTYTDATGKFVLGGLPAGTYTVNVSPDEVTAYVPFTVTNVVVEVGKSTNLNEITLTNKPN